MIAASGIVKINILKKRVVVSIIEDNLDDFQVIPFSKDNSEFDREKAHELAVLIGSAYTQLEQQGEKTWSLPKGYQLIKELMHDNKRKVFGFVAQKDRQVFIIIRGTRTAYEWYNNIKIKYEVYESITGEKWGVTTEGFYSIYIDIREEIREVLQMIRRQFDHVFVAGHSLGGALATLTIPDLLDSDVLASMITVYTFASPRCGDRELASRLNDSEVRHWRIANTEDIVPTLPGATANLFSTGRELEPEREENFITKAYRDLKTKKMKTFEHTGTPIYFTVGTNSIEDNHNLEIIYMKGISKEPATIIEI
ncbi:MAG: lipase family protein [Cyanobacteria bacterium P01_F01_bin.33]